MARIFISYSRVDTAFVEKFYYRLQQMRPNCDVWYDQAPHGLVGGDHWWDEIMRAVAASDIFIYVLSNESVQSKYCQAEFEEARRLQKRIITIQARDKTRLTGELRDIQYVDMKNGVDDPEALARLSGALDRQLSQVRKRRPLWQPRTPKPPDEAIPARRANAPEVDTPTLQLSAPERQGPPRQRGLTGPWATIIAAVITGIFALGAAYIGYRALSGENDGDTPTPTRTESVVAAQPTATTNVTLIDTPQPTLTATDTLTPTITDTPTPTLNIAEIVGTLDAQATVEQATLDSLATAGARATEYAVGTQSAYDQTATATLWTFTPTPNMTASIDAYRTQQAFDQTATATLWTLTPTGTATDTPEPTATHTPTLTPTPDPLQAAYTPVARNDDWTPVTQEFDGVAMVLVPAGCFMMGSEKGYDEEKPVHQVCFEEPFWIDKTEVTNGQFAQFNGQAVSVSYWTGADRPREQITWTEAQAFCESRGARLPTEAEWEYAARGPDGLVYPWGNEWDGSRVVWNRSSSEGTASVGSLPAGASWVGALDLSGNVWEWVADWYGPYPEGSQVNPTGPASGEYRVLRGGSWGDPITDYFRASCRNGGNPRYGFNYRGFRCARSR